MLLRVDLTLSDTVQGNWLTSDIVFFRIYVGNTIEIDWNAEAPSHLNTSVLPTQIREKNQIRCEPFMPLTL